MASIPPIYDNNVPNIDPQLSPLQLALASYMAKGTPLAFAPNERFMKAMQVFTNSAPLSPIDIDPRTGLAREPDISRSIKGIAFRVKPSSSGDPNDDEIFVYRRAPDCGPDEDRYELISIGKRANVAYGTWAYYGPRVGSGRVADGSMLYDNSSGDSGGNWMGAELTFDDYATGPPDGPGWTTNDDFQTDPWDGGPGGYDFGGGGSVDGISGSSGSYGENGFT